MAINKLNLNGTTYDIGEAAGTNTAESVVEFSSADEENPSSADESVALIKSGDTHKSLLEKISAGMKNIRYLLKQVTSLNSALTDSGWQTMTLSSGFTAYSDSVIPRYRKIGKLVEISGAVSPTSSGTGDSNQIQFGTLPEGYRPSQQIYLLCQGSVRTKWLLSVTSGGVVSFGRYSDDSGWASYSSSSWLPFTLQFFVD